MDIFTLFLDVFITFPEIWHICCLQKFEWFWKQSSWRSTILARPSPRYGSGTLLWIDWNSTAWLDKAKGAPTLGDPWNSPPCKRKADAHESPGHDRGRDEELAVVFSKTEIDSKFVIQCHAIVEVIQYFQFCGFL